jgi:hypothetical protein
MNTRLVLGGIIMITLGTIALKIIREKQREKRRKQTQE